jgi:hypothetical protein
MVRLLSGIPEDREPTTTRKFISWGAVFADSRTGQTELTSLTASAQSAGRESPVFGTNAVPSMDSRRHAIFAPSVFYFFVLCSNFLCTSLKKPALAFNPATVQFKAMSAPLSTNGSTCLAAFFTADPIALATTRLIATVTCGASGLRGCSNSLGGKRPSLLGLASGKATVTGACCILFLFPTCQQSPSSQ